MNKMRKAKMMVEIYKKLLQVNLQAEEDLRGEPITYRRRVRVIVNTFENMMHNNEWYSYAACPPLLRWHVIRQLRRARYKVTQAQFASKIPRCHQPKVSRVLGHYSEFCKLSEAEFIDWYAAFSTF